MKTILLMLLAVACTKRVQIKEETTAASATTAKIDTTATKQEDKAINEDVDKKTGPVEVHDVKSTDTYGWVPPPPEAPKGTPSQWKPIKHVVDDKTVKSAGTDTEKKIGEQEHAAATSTDAVVIENHATIVAKKDDVTTVDVGLSWQVKLVILLGVAVLFITTIAFIEPSWLGLPARAIKWLLGLVRRKEPPT